MSNRPKRYEVVNYDTNRCITGTLAECRKRRKHWLKKPGACVGRCRLLPDPTITERGLAACGYSNPGGRCLRRTAYRSIKILEAVLAGRCWWKSIGEHVFDKTESIDNMLLSVTLCRLVVRGLLQREKVKHGNRMQWRYTAHNLPDQVRALVDPGYDKITGACGSVSECPGDDYPDHNG